MSDTRVWRYNANGESRIFDSEDDVPKGGGWADSPAKAGEKSADARAPQPTVKEREQAEAASGSPDKRINVAPQQRGDRPANPPHQGKVR
jgi:hypothetical protein